jgi:branched-subunit amino acid transport protein
MDKHTIIICILLGIITTNLIRVVPMLLIKGQIHNRFLRSFLYYVPYVTLAVMTFPSIIETTVSPLSGAVALGVGIVAAWRRMGLFPVAAICCAIVYLMDSL